MDKNTLDYMYEVLKQIKEKVDESFIYIFPEHEVSDFKNKLDCLWNKIEEMDELRGLLYEVQDHINDLDNSLANIHPKEEEEEEKVEGLGKVEIPTPILSSDSSSSDFPEAKYEKLPFAFLRNVSMPAYTSYYTAYKEAKKIVQQLQKDNPSDSIWNLASNRIQSPVPDAKTLYATLKEVNDAFDTVELTKKHGKTFVRLHKLIQRMLRIAATNAAKKK